MIRLSLATKKGNQIGAVSFGLVLLIGTLLIYQDSMGLSIAFVICTLMYAAPKVVSNEILLDTSRQQFIIRNSLRKDTYIPSSKFERLSIRTPMLSILKLHFDDGKVYSFKPSLVGINVFSNKNLTDKMEELSCVIRNHL
jgi:hypothetical protein